MDPTTLKTWYEITQFARNAEAGQYVYKFKDHHTDPYSDHELSEFSRVLARKDLRLTTDDIGLLVVERYPNG